MCYLSWTSKGILLTNQNKTQIRVNEIVNALKTMDNHFGKQKFRSGNIPFTMFGLFDQKSNILFKDSTDGLKTKFEFIKSSFERNLENFFENIVDEHQYCNHSPSLHYKSSSLTVLTFILVILSNVL